MMWLAIVVVLVAVGSYANSLPNGFLMDDHYNVVENAEIRSLGNIGRIFSHPVGAGSDSSYERRINQNYWRPLVLTSYALDHQIWGLNAIGYHLTNVLLHALVCLLLFLLVHRLTERRTAASAAALLFALHPVHTEVVNLVTYRTELMAALFVLAALLVNATSNRRLGIDLIALPLLYALGLLSKETAVTLPGWLLLQDFACGRLSFVVPRALLRRGARTYVPLLLCLIGYFAVRAALVQAPAMDFFSGLTAWERAWSMLKIYGLYIRLMLWPWPLLTFYDWTVMRPAVSLADAGPGWAWGRCCSLGFSSCDGGDAHAGPG